MKRTIFIYGLALAAFVFIMKLIEYRLRLRDQSLEFYIGIVAVLFVILGIWAGDKLTKRKMITSNSVFRLN